MLAEYEKWCEAQSFAALEVARLEHFLSAHLEVGSFYMRETE